MMQGFCRIKKQIKQNSFQYMLSVNQVWYCFNSHFLLCRRYFPDQTPTPTRFLKNCEEVGLFNELASSFEQDDDDKKAKNSVRTNAEKAMAFFFFFEFMSILHIFRCWE